MPAVRPPMHGRDHRPGGADPIPPTVLTEASATWGKLSRDGAAGALAVTSGSLNATTTIFDHNVVSDEDGVTCDIVSVPSRIVIIEPGLYMIEVQIIDLDSGGSDYGFAVGFGINATGAVWAPSGVTRRTVNGFSRPQAVAIRSLDEGDYITQVVGQNSGSTQTETYLGHLSVVRIPGPISTSSTVGSIDGGSP